MMRGHPPGGGTRSGAPAAAGCCRWPSGSKTRREDPENLARHLHLCVLRGGRVMQLDGGRGLPPTAIREPAPANADGVGAGERVAVLEAWPATR
eukprot:scaffold34822_cov32-Tisochrysis_lutea.AAC.1